MKLRSVIKFLIPFSILFSFPALTIAQGLGGVSVSPKRVVFEDRQRTTEVRLINRGTQATTYRVFFGNMRMEEDGNYTPIEEPGPGDRFAEGLIRYSPRQVTIPPGGSQTVRLMVRKPRDLESGEYRSHLFFRSLPPPDSGANVEALDLKEGELSVQVIANYSISIPVIVRQGTLGATINISDLSYSPPKAEGAPPHLSAKLNRQGERSVFGNLTVNFQPESAGSPVELGRVNGVAVFIPNESRRLDVALYPPDGVNLLNGNLRVTFQEDEQKGNGVFAEEQLSIH